MDPTEPEPKDWKLKLRYGLLETTLKHFTVLAEGCMEDPENPFECRIGPAVMSMHTWAADAEESADMLLAIGREIGFCTTGPSRVYDTPPTKPPPSDDTPYGYDIQFVSFDGPDVA